MTFAATVVMRRTLRDQRRASIVWGMSLGLMSALIVAIYPSISDSLEKAVEGYPDALKETFRVGDIDSAAAYLDTEMFSLIVPIAAGIFAARCISRAIAAAEEQRHLDVLLSAPLTRTALLGGVVAATAVSLAGVLALTVAGAWLGSAGAGAGLGIGQAAAGAASVWPLGLFCAGLAALAAGALHHSAAVTAVSAGTLVAMYVVDLAGKLADGLDWVRWASVFRGYGSALRDGVDVAASGVTALAALVLVVAGAALLERRDIRA